MKGWFKPFWTDIDRSRFLAHHKDHGHVEKLVLTALMAVIATLLQSMGGFLPGIGYLFSPFSTAPLLVITLISPKRGVMAYLLTICLLWIIQPGELFVFPFTTGLLGVGLGLALRSFKKRLSVIVVPALMLTCGIDIVLCLIHFPLLGPLAGTTFSLRVTLSLFIFSFFYSWGWLEAFLYVMHKYAKPKKDKEQN